MGMWLTIGCVLGAATSATALDIVVEYKPSKRAFQDAVTNSGYNPREVMRNITRAEMNWELALGGANVITTVGVTWGNPAGHHWYDEEPDLCGAAGVETVDAVTGYPKTGSMVLNQNTNWFVDPSPNNHNEFDPSQIAGEKWHGDAPATSPAHGKADLLSCTKHEFGHTLGFHYPTGMNDPYQPYRVETLANNGAIKFNDFNMIEIAAGVGATTNERSHWQPLGNVPGTNFPVRNLLMAPNAPINSARTIMSPYDISALAKIYGLQAGMGLYNLEPKQAVPEASTLALVATGGLIAMKCRRS